MGLENYLAKKQGKKQDKMTKPKQRLEQLRKALRSESISYGELAELQSLREFISNDDVELLEACGVEENQQAKHTLPDSIEISWHIDDVLMTAQNEGIKLTKNEARKILQTMKHDHDATIGINWDVISFHINNYKENN